MNRIKDAIDQVGGPQIAADLTGVSVRAVYKWIEKGRLPRTEYTGETSHARNIAKHPKAKFTCDWLLERVEVNRQPSNQLASV